MPYVPTVWVTGDIITAAKANNWETQYARSSSELTTHKTAAVIDHPAGSVGDTAIGNRTANDASTATGNTGTLTNFASWLANKAKAMQGSTAWTDAPLTTLAAAASHITATTTAHGGLTPGTHVGSGGTAHAEATTATAGFLSAATKAMFGGVNLVSTGFVIVNQMRRGSDGCIVGLTSSSGVSRYVIASSSSLTWPMGTTFPPGTYDGGVGITNDSTYLYALIPDSSQYRLRRIALADGSAVELAALTYGTYVPRALVSASKTARIVYNGGVYIYAVTSWQETSSSAYYVQLSRYGIASSSWYFCLLYGTAGAEWDVWGIAYTTDQIIHAAVEGAAPYLVAWSEATTANLGTGRPFYCGSSSGFPRWMQGDNGWVCFNEIEESTGAILYDDQVVLYESPTGSWRFVKLPERAMVETQWAFEDPYFYWASGPMLYRWPVRI